MKRSCWILAAALTAPACVATSASLGQTILRVKSDAPSGGDGATWATAYNTLQAALAAATPGTEIWVAGGTYTGPGAGFAFAIPDGVALYGGFAGMELNRAQRVPDPTRTILTAAWGKTILKLRTVSGVVVDGFKITGGVGRGNFTHIYTISDSYHPGGGAYIDDATATFRNCWFDANQASWWVPGPYPVEAGDGGAAFIRNSNVQFENCSITNNYAEGSAVAGCQAGHPVVYCGPGAGGAMECRNCTLTFLGCTFRSNYSGSGWSAFACQSTGFTTGSGAGKPGGALDCSSCTIVIDRCTFARNSSGYGGYGGGWGAGQCWDSGSSCGNGGAINAIGGSMVVSNSLFVNNYAAARGGGTCSVPHGGSGGAIYAGCTIDISNSTFVGNSAPGLYSGIGGGIFGFANTISNCIFWNNTDSSGDPMNGSVGYTGPDAVSHSIIENIPDGTGNGNSALDPRFFDPLGPDGVLGTGDDRFDLRPDSPAIDAGDNSLYTFGPLDLAGHPRRIDVRGIPDTGVGPGAVIDMGAFEYVPCPADFDDGTGSGRPDGAVTIDDLLVFLGVYTSGSLRADLDNGSMTGTLDGAVTVDDLLYFLTKYEAGC